MFSPDRTPVAVVYSTQRGMTLWSLLYVLVTLGLLIMVAIKSVPVYMNAYDIRTTLESVARQPRLQNASVGEIHQAIQRRFDAGYVDNIKGKDFDIERVDGGRRLFIDYTQRRDLLFNIGLVYSFSESARLQADDGA